MTIASSGEATSVIASMKPMVRVSISYSSAGEMDPRSSDAVPGERFFGNHERTGDETGYARLHAEELVGIISGISGFAASALSSAPNEH